MNKTKIYLECEECGNNGGYYQLNENEVACCWCNVIYDKSEIKSETI